MAFNEELLTGVRWRLLQVLAEHGEQTAAELAAAAKASLPAISQTMRLLEAYGYVQVLKRKPNGLGKPTLAYRLKKEFAILVSCRAGSPGKTVLPLDSWHTFTLNLLQSKYPSERPVLMRFFCAHDELFTLCQAVAELRADEKEIHLLVLSDAVDRIRKEFANADVHCMGEKRKVITWSHTVAEATDGLRRGEQYYRDLFKAPHILFDPDGRIRQVIQNARGGV